MGVLGTVPSPKHPSVAGIGVSGGRRVGGGGGRWPARPPRRAVRRRGRGRARATGHRRDPEVVGVGTDEERRAGGDADALGGEGDDGGAFVVDAHPQVDAVGPGDVDAVIDEHARDRRAPLGVGGAGSSAGVASVCGSRISSSSTDCRIRLDQPGPSSRRFSTAVTTSPAPPTAARRRSGPWLFEKLRMCTVRSGSQVPTLVERRRGDLVGVIVLDHQRRRSAAARRRSPWPGAATSPRRPGSGRAVGGSPPAGCPPATHGAELVDVEALVVDVDADDVARQSLEEVEHRRKPGVLDDHPVAEAQGDARPPGRERRGPRRRR